jgi:tRNA(Ile)-lysidine synthase
MPNSSKSFEIEQKILEFISSNKLIDSGDNLLVALSGGPDSVFLVHFLKKFSSNFNIKIQAAHINHLLRGNDSMKDAEFCSKLCKELKIKLHLLEVNIPRIKESSKKSIEEISREKRYEYFYKICKSENIEKIATAHNKNDNSETVLLNLLKGSSLSGLAGIPIKRANIIRPLLCLTKNEIIEYLKNNDLIYRIDFSNEENRFNRNFLRNQIIPLLEKEINPKTIEAINRTSNNIKSAIKSLNKNKAELSSIYLEANSNEFIIRDKLFIDLDDYTIAEILKDAFKIHLNIEFNSKVYEVLKQLSQNQVGKKNHLSENWIAVKESNYTSITKCNSKQQLEIEFSIGGSVQTPYYSISSEIFEFKEFENVKEESAEFISADNLDDIFILRNWKSGDRFVPLGMNGHKKISDFLTDRKIPNNSRNKTLVLLNKNKIVWVVGYNISDEFKVTSSTKKVCKLCLKK